MEQFMDSFETIYETCRGSTMTSRERMLSLHMAVKMIVDKGIPGDFVECGVWRGGSVMMMAMTLISLGVSDRIIWLYETFDGMPPPSDLDRDINGALAETLMQKENKSQESALWAFAPMDLVKGNLAKTGYPMDLFKFVKGKVEDSLALSHPDKISLLRLDTDWYESTRAELHYLYPSLQPGGVLILDDYGHWQGARKAVDDFLLTLDEPLALETIDYTARYAIKPSPMTRRTDVGPALNIALINTYDDYGGAAKAAYRLFKALRRRGNSATLTVREQSLIDDPNIHYIPPPVDGPEKEFSDTIDALQQAAISRHPKLHPANITPYNWDRAQLGLQLCNKLPDADIINLHWVSGFLDYASFFQKQHRGVIVWTLHDMNAFTGGCHYPGDCKGYLDSCGNCPLLFSGSKNDLSYETMQRKKEIFANTKMPHFVTPSHWLAKEVKRSSLFCNADVTVIPNSLDLNRFRPIDQAIAREQIGVPPDANILFFVSHNAVDWRKGLDLLDQALTKLGPRPDIILITAGYASPVVYAKVTHAHAGQLTKDDAIATLYSAADITVVPSREDNLPNTVMESLACATPVAAFSVGGIPDMIKDGETGFLTPPLDTSAMAHILDSALKNRQRLTEMGLIGRQWAESEYAPDVQAKRYEELFIRILAQSRPRAEL